MSSQRLAIPDLGRIFEGESISGLSEWQLLERYLERRDETAFEALVTRHGPMVLGVCRRALGFSPDAEDAFQATFLILVRRARDLGPRDAIGPWLYGVARRVAARARTQASRRRRYEMAALEFPVLDRSGSPVAPDLFQVLDQELSRLPAKYRSPLVLCYLEGRTHEEAARELQWPVGTVKGRLARARELLRSRLARRGFAPTAGVLGVLSSSDLRSILDRPLVECTVEASVKLAAGQSVAQVVSRSITSLVEGVLGTMFLNRMKWAALAAVATGFAFTSAAVLGRQPGGGGGPRAKGAAQHQSGLDAMKASMKKAGRPTPAVGGGGEVALAGTDDGRANDPRSRKILQKLEEPVSMSFANETPLDDVLKYIRQATTTKEFPGIPIYADPVGLQEAERSLQSTIQIDLEGIPLRRTLQLILTQLGLAYFVDDGILVITSAGSADDRLPPMHGPTPILEKAKKAERGELTAGEMKELIEHFKLRNEVIRIAAQDPYAKDGGEHQPRGRTAMSNPDRTAELIKELRELIQLLKAEKQAKKSGESK
jgi:RNA polymerase sigma factor (sigma-70 family)